MIVSSRPGHGTFPSRLMPDYIQLKTDKAGWPIQPKGLVSTSVQNRDTWHTVLGPLDVVTAAIVDGELQMPNAAQALLSQVGPAAIQLQVVGDQ